MKKLKTSQGETSWVLFATLIILTIFLLSPNFAFAADLFSGGKEAIKDTVGTDSSVETAILSAGVISAAAGGFLTKNWMGAVGSFVVGMIFWSVAAPLVGLA